MREEKPDAVIVATGAEPFIPSIPGATSKKVVHAWDVLSGKSMLKNRKVLILGGGTVGCETAEYLAEQGNEVTIVEMLSRPADDMERLNRRGLLDKLPELGVKILVEKKVTDISDEGVIVRDVSTGVTERLYAGQVVIAMGVKPVNPIAVAVEDELPELYVIGDCAGPRNVIDAVYEGSVCARRV